MTLRFGCLHSLADSIAELLFLFVLLVIQVVFCFYYHFLGNKFCLKMTKSKRVFKKRKSFGRKSVDSGDIIDPSFDHLDSRELLDIESLSDKVSSNVPYYEEYRGKDTTYDLIRVDQLSKVLSENANCGNCKAEQSLQLSVTKRTGLQATLELSCEMCHFSFKFSNSTKNSYQVYDEESESEDKENSDAEGNSSGDESDENSDAEGNSSGDETEIEQSGGESDMEVDESEQNSISQDEEQRGKAKRQRIKQSVREFDTVNLAFVHAMRIVGTVRCL